MGFLMARVLGDTPGHSPPLWLIWTDVHLCFCTSPHLIPKLGAPRLKDLPTFHTPDPLKALSRRCVHGCRAGDGNQDMADVIFGCRRLD